ncbi:hypothetical protein [Haloprofundus salilacus]|uniref:hypothetical protein n=1 Tax=Haloprofundus salilacus TaxID=2876190 RepID=UPI001CCCE409|nr:hypothetical protein [Haloprofundus salilacus]
MADEFEFPEPQPGPSARRLAVRLGCTTLLSLLLVVLFWEFVVQWLPLLWPPTDPLSRWLSIVAVFLGSLFLLPGIVGSVVGDALYDRWSEERDAGDDSEGADEWDERDD